MNNEKLYSDEIRKAISKMRKGLCTLEELQISKEDINELIEFGLNIAYNESTNSYYIDTISTNNYEIISLKSKEPKDVKWLELSDFHVGSKFFDEETLRYVLDKAKTRGYKYVHIAGDLCAGHPKYKKQWQTLNLVTAEEQAKKVVEILSDYPCFEYHAVHGDCDCSFEKYDSINPLLIIKKELNEKGIKFNYFNDYAANLIIEGVVKRIVHLKESRRAYTRSYRIDMYLRQQFENIGDNVLIGDRNYNLAFIQFGHLLINTYDIKGSTYLTSTSGFIFDKTNSLGESSSYPSARFCDTTIENCKVTKFVTTVIRKYRKID